MKKAISRSNAHATNVLKMPMPIAAAESGITRAVVVKSPNSWELFAGAFRS